MNNILAFLQKAANSAEPSDSGVNGPTPLLIETSVLGDIPGGDDVIPTDNLDAGQPHTLKRAVSKAAINDEDKQDIDNKMAMDETVDIVNDAILNKVCRIHFILCMTKFFHYVAGKVYYTVFSVYSLVS